MQLPASKQVPNDGAAFVLVMRHEPARQLAFHLNYARCRSRCWLVEGATPFGTPENSALKQ